MMQSTKSERNGQLAQSLELIANDLQERFDLNVERLTRIAEPSLIFLVSMIIAGIVLLVYMPIFDLAGGVF
jgi:general secretion pathway protein F